MTGCTDQELLRAFAVHRTEVAFAELVRRHLNLVHSAARRLMAGSSHSAEDVAQQVFVELARQASRLKNRQVLETWLYTTTRFVAANLRRAESRRQDREREFAMTQFSNSPADDPDWEAAARVLEDTMHDLDEEDRSALLLRFFSRKEFRAVGDALRVSEDAARMRVNRALEKLHGLLTRRGVVLSAAALGSALTAGAVTAAPAGLAVSISSAALATAAAGTGTTFALFKLMTMTKLQTAIIGAVVIAGVATPLVLQHETQARLRDENASLRQQLSQLDELKAENATLSNQLSQARDAQPPSSGQLGELMRLRAEVARLREYASELERLKSVGGQGAPLEQASRSWLSRVDQLKQHLQENPTARIPELQLATEQDWLNAARGELRTDADYRRALSRLRGAAEDKVASRLQKALRGYMRDHNDQMPTDLSQMKPYFDPPLDDAILQRWEIAPASTIRSLGMGGDILITQKGPVDEVFDNCYGVGPNGRGSTDYLSRQTAEAMRPVFDAFRAEHQGQWHDNLAQLIPYATTPEQQAALEKLMLRDSGSK